jgi:phosphomevalonate kinase
MRVRAPGKLLITGAYAVLEGAPAVVIAVNRYVYVRSGDTHVDTRELYDGERKLGLGSSAATAVARLALEAACRGEDLDRKDVRKRIFQAARERHAAEQSGGSGVDIAACTFGGALRYTVAGGPTTMRLPPGLVLRAFWSGVSARTSDQRAKVSALRSQDPERYAAVMGFLAESARCGERAAEAGDRAAFVVAATLTCDGLTALGQAAGAPIVPEPFARLALRAREECAAFLPSGAGAGDVALFVGERTPSALFLHAAREGGFAPLEVELDERGVCVCSKA